MAGFVFLPLFLVHEISILKIEKRPSGLSLVSEMFENIYQYSLYKHHV